MDVEPDDLRSWQGWICSQEERTSGTQEAIISVQDFLIFIAETIIFIAASLPTTSAHFLRSKDQGLLVALPGSV